jgi:hypothetical protein
LLIKIQNHLKYDNFISSGKEMVAMKSLHKRVAMRKVLFVILTIFAFAMFSVSVYAYPPIIHPIPDIVIGDEEDNAGWTIDRNLFRFPEAFSFLDYVSDHDTPATALKWSFIEEVILGGTPTDWFEINGITQTTLGNTNPPPTEKDLTLGGTDFTPSLRDIYASPHSEDPGPYTGITEAQGLHSKLIWLYASDGTGEDSHDVMFSSIDGTFDCLSPCYPFQPRYTFDTTLEGWSFLGLSVPPYFSGASSGYSGGRLGISSANDSTSRVGFWQSQPTDIAYKADNVYRARFLASSSQTVAAQNPQFRMRWVQALSLESVSHVVNASAPQSYSLPTDPTTKEYACYFAPILSGAMGVTFDMLDFDAAQSGTHYVDEVVVERFPDPAAGTAVKTYTDTADFSNWGFVTNVGYGPVTSGGSGTGTLTITSTTANSSNFGWWQSSGTANELTYVADKLYRATFTLRCVSDLARNDMPQVRLRGQNEDGQLTAAMELNSQGVGGPGAMPSVGGTDYEVYWETPTLPGSPTAGQDGAIVTIDLLDFDGTKGGTIYMDSVVVDYLEIP